MTTMLRPSAAAIALAVTLVVVFVLCAISEVIVPAAPAFARMDWLVYDCTSRIRACVDRGHCSEHRARRGWWVYLRRDL